MNELDMSRPGSELFPESTPQQYNSYQDVNMGQVVNDPLDMGVTPDVANQGYVSDKEMNFRALRDEAAKLKQEASYWRGQAEAYSKQPAQSANEQSHSLSPDKVDWEDSGDVRKAWENLHNENQRLRDEMRDSLAAVNAKNRYQDWNTKVAQHVPQLTNENPIFAEMIKNTSNPYEAAYLLADLNSRASNPNQQRQPDYSGNAQRVAQNSQKPQSLASVGGQSQLGSVDYYAQMSDEDFMKIAQRNLANI